MYKDYETPRFWITYGEGITSYVKKNVLDTHDANDIIHDIYLKIFTHCKRFGFCCNKAGVSNLQSWIFRICHNTIIDYRKSKAKYLFEDKYCENYLNNTFIIKNETEELPLKLLNQLPPLYAKAVYYDAVLEVKQEEIAQKLHISLSCAKSRIQRGKKMLKAIYIEQLKK